MWLFGDSEYFFVFLSNICWTTFVRCNYRVTNLWTRAQWFHQQIVIMLVQVGAREPEVIRLKVWRVPCVVLRWRYRYRPVHGSQVKMLYNIIHDVMNYFLSVKTLDYGITVIKYSCIYAEEVCCVHANSREFIELCESYCGSCINSII